MFSRLSVRVAKLVYLVSLCSTAVGCSGGSFDEVGPLTDEVEQELYVKTDSIWRSLSIPVCWENPTAATSTARTWAKDQATKTWQSKSKLKFTGWGTCAANAKGIRIRIADITANTGKLLGRQLDGVKNGMTLNLTMNDAANAPGYPKCKDAFGLESCVRATAVHEFGHALGFAHEQMRLDNPAFDCFILGGEIGDVRVGSYDKLSVMRTCSVMDLAQATLSSTDTLGLRAFYGSSTSVGTRKDVVVWDDQSAYFFFGKEYVRYSVTLDAISDMQGTRSYPALINLGWGNWPKTSPWTNGIDTVVNYSSQKVYFFSGNQYARYDKANDRVDAGYPVTLPGGWKNWPSTWTGVDAALKSSTGKQYLFRGTEYLRISSGVTVDKGYPKPIAGNWDIPFPAVDRAVLWPDGRAYFFKDDQYIRYDMTTDTMDAGYPLPIVGRWPGVTF